MSEKNQLLKLARELGKMTYKLKQELGFEETRPQMKPLVRPIIKGSVVTAEMADQAMIDIARSHGISVENKSVEEVRRELTLKMRKSRS